MLKYFTLLAFFFFPVGLLAQDKAVVDSLQGLLLHASHDSTRVNVFNALSWEYRNFNLSEALHQAKKALELAEQIRFERGSGNAYRSIGIVYWLKGDHSIALKHLFNSLKILEKIKDKSNMAFTMNYIGNIYSAQEDYEEALRHFFKALDIYRELNDLFKAGICLNNIGRAYRQQKNYPDALQYLNQCLSISRQLPHEELGSFARSNIGEVYLRMSDYQQARQYFMEALEVARKKNNRYLIGDITINLGITYFQLAEMDKAEEFAMQGLEVAKATGLKDQIKDACKILADIYALKKDFAKAYDYQVLFAAYRDSVFNKQTTEKISSQRLTYELEKKQMEINLLQENADLDRYLRYSLTAGLAVAFVLAFVTFFGYRQKAKTNRTLLEQQQEILEKNREITEQREEIAMQATHLRELNEHVLNKNASLEQLMEETGQQASNLRELNEYISAKNAELEALMEEIAVQRNNILEKSEKLEKANANIQTLSRIGMEVTATLHIETILHTLYGHVNQLMPAEIFGIGIYQPEKEEIKIMMVIHGGQHYHPYNRDMRDKNQLAVWCIDHKKPMLIHDIHHEYHYYIESYQEGKVLLDDQTPVPGGKSMIYCPLLLKERVLGIVSVQTSQAHSYTELHLEMLRTLAAYTAIALDNAQTYNKLDQAMQQLKNAQAQLVQSEKMASLGQLTAGIAHEINNPVNFIYAGINSLKTNFAELMEVLDAYCRLSPALPEIEQLKQEIHFDEVRSEADELLGSIRRGAERTAEIVKGLRTFSRLDEDALKTVDLHENLEATLVMLRNQYKEHIEIVRNYGQLPKVECYPGKLNQLFMNILSNAIQAIQGQGRIEITTTLHGLVARISIRDSGKGMSEDVKKRIFEPFFTTKDVGEGTGLGLSISHSIVEKHQGSIEVESKEGQGTCFTIQIPVKH